MSLNFPTVETAFTFLKLVCFIVFCFFGELKGFPELFSGHVRASLWPRREPVISDPSGTKLNRLELRYP